MSAPPSEPGRVEYDPVFLHARREALIIFGVWLAALLWSVPYCYLNGYQGHADAADLAKIWGMPAWIFWGILVPWIAADVFTVWFCFCYMADDDLGESPEERAESAHAASPSSDDSGEGARA